MSNLITSTVVDNFMQAVDVAGARAALGLPSPLRYVVFTAPIVNNLINVNTTDAVFMESAGYCRCVLPDPGSTGLTDGTTIMVSNASSETGAVLTAGGAYMKYQGAATTYVTIYGFETLRFMFRADTGFWYSIGRDTQD